MRELVARSVALAVVLYAASLGAQPARVAPADGLYEAWSPLALAPTAPLPARPAALPRWLSVRTESSETRVTFEPDRRVVWRLRIGPHGLTERIVEVDQRRVERSAYAYDAAGHLTQERVEGASPGSLRAVLAYETDPTSGRILARVNANRTRRWQVTWSAAGAILRESTRRRAIRVDAFDAGGRPTRTEFPLPGRREPLALVYLRDGGGALVGVTRSLGGAPAPCARSSRSRTTASGSGATSGRPKGPSRPAASSSRASSRVPARRVSGRRAACTDDTQSRPRRAAPDDA